MKTRLLWISLGAVIVSSLLTGCGKNEGSSDLSESQSVSASDSGQSLSEGFDWETVRHNITLDGRKIDVPFSVNDLGEGYEIPTVNDDLFGEDSCYGTVEKPGEYYPEQVCMVFFDGIKADSYSNDAKCTRISFADTLTVCGIGAGSSVKNAEENGRATVFGYYVPDPERFGVVEFDKEGHVISIEEKPKRPKSKYAVTGLYFYPAGVAKRAAEVKPSERGELEITTLNEMYLNDGLLDVQLLGRGFAWLDTGTMKSLLQAANFVETIQSRQGIIISAPEEIAYINGFIDKKKLAESARAYGKSPYGEHLLAVTKGRVMY